MGIIKIFYESIFMPLEVINRKRIGGKLAASIVTVLVTAFFGSVLAPVLYYFNYKNKLEVSLDIKNFPIMFLASALTWLTACVLFWLLAFLYKKHVSFAEILSTWGFSYTPNLLCIVAYSLIQVQFNLFISSAIIGFLINTFFIMLLVWKAIYFFIEMKFVIGTTGLELFTISLTTGVVFMLLMWFGSLLGIQVPML